MQAIGQAAGAVGAGASEGAAQSTLGGLASKVFGGGGEAAGDSPTPRPESQMPPVSQQQSATNLTGSSQPSTSATSQPWLSNLIQNTTRDSVKSAMSPKAGQAQQGSPGPQLQLDDEKRNMMSGQYPDIEELLKALQSQ